jgi:hypothetical protein
MGLFFLAIGLLLLAYGLVAGGRAALDVPWGAATAAFGAVNIVLAMMDR